MFQDGRVYIPETIYRQQYDGRTIELIDTFLVEEFDAFPVAEHDDMLDALSRIMDADMQIEFPMGEEEPPDRYTPESQRFRRRVRTGNSAWSA